MKKVLVAVLLMAGCAAHVQHPGTANAFDSDTYDALLVAHSVIESTKSDISAGSFPASILPQVKTALNGMIDAYDALDVAYCNPQAGTLPSTGAASLQCAAGSYHAAAMAGTATTAQSAQLQSQVNNLNSATSALAAAKKAK
jgi:hypothetical protein